MERSLRLKRYLPHGYGSFCYYDSVNLDFGSLCNISNHKDSHGLCPFTRHPRVSLHAITGQWNYCIRASDFLRDEFYLKEDPKINVYASSSCFNHTYYAPYCEDVLKISIDEQPFSVSHFVAVKRLKTPIGVKAYDSDDRIININVHQNHNVDILPFCSPHHPNQVSYFTTLYLISERMNIAQDYWTNFLANIE